MSTATTIPIPWTAAAAVGGVEGGWRDLRSGGDAAASGALEVQGRALALNLICRARDAADAARLAESLWELGPRHPARVFLVVPGPSPLRLRLAAAPRGAEILEIEADDVTNDAAAERVLSIIAPLLVADLPVVLLWRNGDPALHPEFRQWASLADRVLVDAHRMHLTPAALAAARQWLSPRTGFNDLTWTRLTPWRQLLCQGLECVPGLTHSIRRLTLAGPCNLAALLLAGWMAHKLDWSDDQVEIAFAPGPRHEALLSRMEVEGDHGSVVLEHHGLHVTMTAHGAPGTPKTEWSVGTGDRELLRGERDTLCEELSIGGADHLFLSSLERGLALLARWTPRPDAPAA